MAYTPVEFDFALIYSNLVLTATIREKGTMVGDNIINKIDK